MFLRVVREPSDGGATMGALYIDGVFECWTLEDQIREVKIATKTAIPAGEYKVVIDMSTRFNSLMPHVLDVPNFSGIRIHPGNTPENTDGCILLGQVRGNKAVGFSQAAFKAFMKKLDAVKVAVIRVDNPVLR